MTCGITVAPRMPTASSTRLGPVEVGNERAAATPRQEGFACNTWNPNATTITPTRMLIVASKRRNPAALQARIEEGGDADDAARR